VDLFPFSHSNYNYVQIAILRLTMLVVVRVTRFGEFSPFGWLFTLCSFVKIIEVAQNNSATLFHGKSYVLIFKKWIGLHFGRLFHKRIWSPWL
jgi:hypothetical protein